MALKIIWTPQAEKGLESVLNHLDEEWSVNELLNLERNIKSLLKLISEYPKSCPSTSKYRNVHRGIVDKNNYIIYRVNYKSKLIEIINFKGTKEKPL